MNSQDLDLAILCLGILLVGAIFIGSAILVIRYDNKGMQQQQKEAKIWRTTKSVKADEDQASPTITPPSKDEPGKNGHSNGTGKH